MLLFAGYWPTTYFPKSYWNSRYWPGYAGWRGKVFDVTNPDKVFGISSTDIEKICGVE